MVPQSSENVSILNENISMFSFVGLDGKQCKSECDQEKSKWRCCDGTLLPQEIKKILLKYVSLPLPGPYQAPAPLLVTLANGISPKGVVSFCVQFHSVFY